MSPVLLFLLTSSTLTLAAAEPTAVSLQWEAPAGCPAPEEVLRWMTELAGRSPAAPLRVEGVVRELPEAGFELRLVVRQAAGVLGARTLRVETCAQTGEAAALIVSLSLPPRAPDVGTAAAQDGPAPQLHARARGGASVGTLPGLNAAVGVAAGVQLGRGRLELDFTYHAPVELAPTGASPGAAFALPWMVGLGGCLTAWQRGLVALDGCGGVGLGEVNGRAPAVSEPLTGSSWWLELRAGAAVGVRLAGPVFARLEALATAPIIRPTFRVQGVGALYAVPAVGGRLGVGIELRGP